MNQKDKTMTHQINYSFTHRGEPEGIYSINVPLERFEGMELSLDTVRNVVEEDLDLMTQLMGDDLKAYESMSVTPHLYQKELQRHEESLRLVLVEKEQSLDIERVESALKSIVSHLDYDLHKNLLVDEETEENSYPELAQDFINLYTK